MIIATIASALALVAGPQAEITVYNEGFGLVKELRQLHLKQGPQTVEIRT